MKITRRFVSAALIAAAAITVLLGTLCYVVSAFFPCDPGAPLWGSWRTPVQNVAGLVDYGGTAIGFLLVCRCLARGKVTAQAAAFGVGGVLALVCLAVLVRAVGISGPRRVSARG